MSACSVALHQARRLAGLGLLLCASACIVDGRYFVRGTITEGGDGGMKPVVMGSVKVGPERERSSTRNGSAFTATDGTYQAEYWFGGMWPLIQGGDPLIEFSAPGRAACRFKLVGTETPAGVTRRPCGESPAPWCFVIDVALAPEAQVSGGGP